MMRYYVLTSSRADFGIYLPLLKKMRGDVFFDLRLVAFGMHLSEAHGYTLEEIKRSGFHPYAQVETPLNNKSPWEISESVADTMKLFSSFWEKEKDEIDFIICLGDRYEMYAAVSATIPFSLPVIHIHGGETTLGAIDNIYRHSITLLSRIHFCSTHAYGKKIQQLTGSDENIFNVGALGLDNIDELELLSNEEMIERFNLDFSQATVLCTFHPETVNLEGNAHYLEVIEKSLMEVAKSFQVIITKPNADTFGDQYAEMLNRLNHQNIKVVNSLGAIGYHSAMKLSSFLLGNTSSGIIEAASHQKYVLNVGDRQKGRAAGNNVLDAPYNVKEIVEASRRIQNMGDYKGSNIYKKGNASDQIILKLKCL